MPSLPLSVSSVRLPAVAVAAVGAPLGRRPAEVVIRLGVRRPLRPRPFRLVDEAVLAEGSLGIASRQEPIEQLVGDHRRFASCHARVPSFPSSWPAHEIPDSPRQAAQASRPWLHDGSCTRLRPAHANHVRSYGFVADRTHGPRRAGGPSIRAAAEVSRPRRDGRRYRLLAAIDASTREGLAIRVDRKLSSVDVIDVLADLFILRGVPGRARSDSGPELAAKPVRAWIAAVGAEAARLEPGSPLGDPPIAAVPAGPDRRLRRRGGNGCRGSFNSKLRDAPRDGGIFCSLEEARVVIAGWRRHRNAARPHSAPGYRPPAPEVVLWPAPPASRGAAPQPVMHQHSNRTTQQGPATQQKPCRPTNPA